MALSIWMVHDEKLPLNLAIASKGVVSCGLTSDMFPYPVAITFPWLSSTSILRKIALKAVSPLMMYPVSITLPTPATHVNLLKFCTGMDGYPESAWANWKEKTYNKNIVKRIKLMVEYRLFDPDDLTRIDFRLTSLPILTGIWNIWYCHQNSFLCQCQFRQCHPNKHHSFDST